MNEVIQYVATVTALANQGAAIAVPLRVPLGMAFRVRSVDFRFQGLGPTDETFLVALSRFNREPAKTSTQFTISNHWIAYGGYNMEIQTTGMATIRINQLVDVWDYDYRLVMQPTLQAFAVQLAAQVDCAVAGVLVRISEGERNAIIAWQGGVPKNG